MGRTQPMAGASEVVLLADRYLTAADGDPLAALRLALSDALRDAVDARLRILDLERAASIGYLRGGSGLRHDPGDTARAA